MQNINSRETDKWDKNLMACFRMTCTFYVKRKVKFDD